MNNKMRKSAIGVFDSGIGGLTVVKEIIKALPREDIIYLGDTARVPYGTRGKETIIKFALEMTDFLLKHKVKFLVVACNTISATCLKQIQNFSQIPVLGVINPAVKKAIDITKTQHIGVICTRATTNSGIYEKEIKSLNPKIKVITRSCPLFVPFAEEGLISHPALEHIAKDYLKEFKDGSIDTLILGCTHYPMLASTIQKIVGKNITLIDSAEPTAMELKSLLTKKGLLNTNHQSVSKFYVTDAPCRVKEIAYKFFGHISAGELKKINLGN